VATLFVVVTDGVATDIRCELRLGMRQAMVRLAGARCVELHFAPATAKTFSDNGELVTRIHAAISELTMFAKWESK